ncbi:MAG: tRNA (adenosine(37)-N6)-threonylcarbamoyltransferase complex ATPase subunit type 1 TsaE [Deltaproteobacteria bacterium]|nr:tRNA (adenosine(37)-N6)-threonylcarbamoyltransferase complex ATPase subunit type 1 TsaE [Deltaproteobacteria bacterium]
MGVSVVARSPEETYALGVRLGALAAPGTVVLLIGDLGAGKTLFARGVGEGLGVQTRVQSPTFVIVQAHTGGRLPLWHADLYRLGDESEVEQLGLDELMEGDGLTLFEWADRFPEIFPSDHLEIRFEEVEDHRVLHLRSTGPAHRPLEEGLGR